MNTEKWTSDFIVDLKQKTSSSSTIKCYSGNVRKFLLYFSNYREPKEVPTREIKEYLLTFSTHNTRKQNLCSLRRFYHVTVGMPNKVKKIPYPNKQRKLPRVIDSEYINKIINEIPNLKHKTIIATSYACALRRSELINLKISNIDRKRMLILIENAKRAKDRYVKLPENLLQLFETYYRSYRPKEYLFNGKSKNHLKYSASSYNNIVKKYLGFEFSTHSLRHSSTTSMHENGVDLATLAKILGHNSIRTTEIYTHVSQKAIQNVESPLKLVS